MDFSSKKVIFLGSSVTCGADGYSMCEVVRDALGCKALKWAVSGTTLADLDESSYVSRLNAHIENEEGCDLFICQLSTNDASRPSLPIGEISDSTDKSAFDTKSIVGAIEYIIATVRERYGCKIAFYTGSYLGKAKYREMVEALFKVAEKWQIDVIDLWYDEGMRSISVGEYWSYMSDPVHPNKKGYVEWWGPKFVDYCRNNL